jgi:hypothetical protein
MVSASKLLAIGFSCLLMVACQPVTDPSVAMTGIYTLERVDGPADVQGVGTLVFTRQGYAERRIRYREADSTLSKEWLARGDATLNTDGTIEVAFLDIDPQGTRQWHPEVRLTSTGIELIRYSVSDLRIVETYRRQ